ncbi:unnamed protein product [Darwinula stevensoni]|uniref:G-protein coupled receptors family 1 profile domain-containing protein n=1 Tax=Darwinula stevensoni TaxID=69355 RepID=A0A7R9AE15_9CRUS|nr:unnamed protein product [Darwinula stevensoni]CAG0901601.1 unnamed protein product [Darwinula stevensoni]
MDRADEANSTANGSELVTLYQVEPEEIVILSLFYGFISLTGTLGNGLVIWIVCTSTRLQNTTNYFIANLALADLILAVLAVPFQFQAALLQRWNLPSFLCPFCPFFNCLSVNVSVGTLMAIAVDRYLAIVNPLSHRPTASGVKLWILVIWSTGVALALPHTLAHRVVYVPDYVQGGNKPFCDVVGMDRKVLDPSCIGDERGTRVAHEAIDRVTIFPRAADRLREKKDEIRHDLP